LIRRRGLFGTARSTVFHALRNGAHPVGIPIEQLLCTVYENASCSRLTSHSPSASGETRQHISRPRRRRRGVMGCANKSLMTAQVPMVGLASAASDATPRSRFPSGTFGGFSSCPSTVLKTSLGRPDGLDMAQHLSAARRPSHHPAEQQPSPCVPTAP
jgi:hypothetical protein